MTQRWKMIPQETPDPDAYPFCKTCHGLGRHYVQDGPDDVDIEVCQCVIDNIEREESRMGTLLKEYRSKSSAKVYEVLEPNGGGDPYCTCPGWKFSKDTPRSCKHLKDYLANESLTQAGIEVDEPIDENVTSGDEYEQAIVDVMDGTE